MSKTENARRLHRRLIGVVVALVVYGSLFPFHYQAHDPSWADLIHLARLQEIHQSRSDIIGNVLLFLPYGLLMAALVSRGRQALGLLGGVALALAVQYLQFWFPDRDPNGRDALLNVVGIGLGWVMGKLLWPLLGRWQALVLERPHFALVTSGLMLLWLADRWFPLVPTLDVQNVKNGIKPLLDWSTIGKLDVLRHLAGWLVFLRLARYSPLQRLSAEGLSFLCVLIVMAEPLFLGNTVGPDNLIGLALALILAPLLRTGPVSLVVVVGVLLGAISVSALVPFQLVWVGRFQWVPFAGALTGDPLSSLAPLIEKLFWYGSLVFFSRYLGLSHRRTCWAVAGWLLGLELVQMWLPGRSPEITDPLLALALAWAVKPLFEGARQQTAHMHAA